MHETKNNSLIVQGSILALAGIITKIIGFIYRIPMANMLGEQGNGIYSVSFGIYNVVLTLSSYSLPLALSKLISSRLAKNESKNAYILFKRALIFALIAGICAFSVLFFGAEWLEALYTRIGLSQPLKVLAPTAFIVALLGVFRGYFQGHSNMLPTALSQVLEQIINAIVSIIGTFFFVRAFYNSQDVAAYGAAGATLGTLAGAFGALIMLALFFATQISKINSSNSQDLTPNESRKKSYFDILATMLPIIISQTIYQIGFTVDDLMFGNIMFNKGIDDATVSSIQGVFNTQYTQLINLPIAIATSLAVSALPSIVSLHTKGNYTEKNKKISSVIKTTMVISIPSAVGLAVLARPIITLLFPSLVNSRELAVSLLQYGSIACVFYSLSTITTSVLQGNNKMKIPVINSSISFALHLVLVFVLLQYTNLSVYALLIGDVTFPLVIALLNCNNLRKSVGYTFEYEGTFIKPFIISAIMGALCVSIYKLLEHIEVNTTTSFLISLLIAISFYLIAVIKSKVFTNEELLDLPIGNKIVKIARRINKK